MNMLYDNSSFFNFFLNEFVDIWVVRSDNEGLYTLEEITDKCLLPFWLNVVGEYSYMRSELRRVVCYMLSSLKSILFDVVIHFVVIYNLVLIMVLTADSQVLTRNRFLHYTKFSLSLVLLNCSW